MSWGIIIALLLCLPIMGSMYCFDFLQEANSAGPWIATGICIVLTFAVICYLTLNEMWSLKSLLSIIGVFGFIQFIIISTVKIPSFAKDYKVFAVFMGGFFSQPLICLIGYGISIGIKKILERKISDLVSDICIQLEHQIEDLNIINAEISKVSNIYKKTDDLLSLFRILNDTTIEQSYIAARSQKDSCLLKKIENILKEKNLQINTKDITTTRIQKDITRKIKEKRTLLLEISQGNYSKKNYRLLKKIFKIINQ